MGIYEIGVTMKTDEFQGWAAELYELTPHQRGQVAECLHTIEHVQAIHTLIENRVLNSPVCPKCGHDHIARWGKASGLQRYRCASCHVTFNALTGTPLARLRHKDKWLGYAQQLTEGQSLRNSATACGVHRNTTFRWRHRFLALPREQKAATLVGIAEADETYFLESFKGRKHDMPRAPHQRSAKALDAAVREIGITHRPINLAAGIRVIGRVYHVQNVNAYGSRLKEWMRRFHGIATRYLANYLGWRRLIDRNHGSLSPTNVILAALGVSSFQ